jgi:hypothetical protein
LNNPYLIPIRIFRGESLDFEGLESTVCIASP